MIRPEDCLGLLLAWSRTWGSMMVLQLIFGMTMTNLSIYVRFAHRIIIEVLHDDPMAAIQLPSRNKIEEYKNAIQQKHRKLENVWCTIDGLKLKLQQAPGQCIQERFYNGWTHDHYVTSVLCFCPDGTIPIAYFNAPGSFHDSKVARIGGVYDKLRAVYDANGGKCTADSAFCGGENYNFIIKSSANPLNAEGATRVERERAASIQMQATSMRQSAEWGMHAVQSSFPRLKDRISYEERGERKLLLLSLFLIYNLRTQMVGINQILNYYMPYLNRNANSMTNV